jgi:hypothetical protein
MPPSDAVGGPFSRAFREPLFQPSLDAPGGVRETSTVAFADLVRLMAEAVADAQTALDRASAELVAELAETVVTVVPQVTETIDAEGNVSFEQGEPRQVSLLALGVLPTFYQFSQTVIEAALDLKLVESETSSGERRDKRFGLFADTASLRTERRLNRDVTISSKVTATLQPVPMPLRVEPARIVNTPEPS